MPKHCTNVMFTFQDGLSSSCTRVPETLAPRHLNQRFNSSFFNCSGFRPSKDAPGTSSSVKIVGKGLIFDLLTSLKASFAVIVLNLPGVSREFDYKYQHALRA